jgi:hypothetical protein
MHDRRSAFCVLSFEFQIPGSGFVVIQTWKVVMLNIDFLQNAPFRLSGYIS